MTRLRRTSPDQPGWTRKPHGRGFSYLDEDGNRLAPDQVARIRSLAIPPAWRDVWITPDPLGHLQAVGTDDAGRRQYRYHDEWRRRRDDQKFERVTRAALALPTAREAMLADLGQDGMSLERAAAAAVRLLDLGYFRIGSDAYAENDSFGLTTLLRRHVRKRGEVLVFSFVGKSQVEHRIEIDDAAAITAVDTMRRRRGGSDRLLAYKRVNRWSDLGAEAVNEYLRHQLGEELTAKDFRTWHATVLAAAALARSDEHGESAASRKRAVAAAMREVAGYLGNTPAVARSSYVDPRVVEQYERGATVAPALAAAGVEDGRDASQAALEQATLELLGIRADQ